MQLELSKKAIVNNSHSDYIDNDLRKSSDDIPNDISEAETIILEVSHTRTIEAQPIIEIIDLTKYEHLKD